jgi:L-methionine (R)-S-oxide reductase
MKNIHSLEKGDVDLHLHKKKNNIPDVNLFDGHIACSILTKSELVIPFFKDHKIIGVLDIDSEKLNNFSEHDQSKIESFVKLLEINLKP